MNYADIHGGTWYPEKGMYSVVEGMFRLAEETGVKFHFNENVKEILIEKGKARKVVTDKNVYETDIVISSADYHFTETTLLPPEYKGYSDTYWGKRLMAPSCLLYYVGLNKKLKNVAHHSLFFDAPFEQHGKEIYSEPGWPSDPLFYVSVPSVSDTSVAPQNGEALVFLIPVAAGLNGDTEELRTRYFDSVIKRMERHIGETFRGNIVYQRSYSVSDFVHDYNSFKGNAYGLANTLRQTAIFRPSCRSKKVKNLFYTGQLTVPGPGVPPSLISGEVVAKEVIKAYG
jgi:phytoene desaturase